MQKHTKIYSDRGCCKNCNKPTALWGDRYKKYCNVFCQREFENKADKKTFTPITCHYCKSTFLPKSNINKYCSRFCKTKVEINSRSARPVSKKCKVCNATFSPYNSLDKFCSMECRVENVKSKRNWRWSVEKTNKRFGKNNPSYAHGLSVRGAKKDSTGLRLFRKNRDEYKQELIDKNGYLSCERCGESGKKLEAHHIVFRSEKPNHEFLHSKINMIIVCVPCHNWFHKAKGNRNDIVKKRELNKLFGNDVLDKQAHLTFMEVYGKKPKSIAQ